jgi:hypothetical protein
MPTYLVERYLPGRDLAWIEAALARLPDTGRGVVHLSSWYVPADDSCFCTFEASDASDVRLVNELAQVPFARITETHQLTIARHGRDQEGGSV